jgi:hypothetical protein
MGTVLKSPSNTLFENCLCRSTPSALLFGNLYPERTLFERLSHP